MTSNGPFPDPVTGTEDRKRARTLPAREGLDRLWGRRHGKRLRPGQKRLLETLLPQLRVPEPEPGEHLDIAALFGGHTPAAVWLEIGFGAGEHMCAQAETHPAAGIIGCEPFVQGMAKALARIDEKRLENIRLFDGDARRLLTWLPPGSLSRIFLLFPDPWPKKRHHKRRFVQQETLDEFARLLRPGGEFRFASDIPSYVRWTLEHVVRHGGFEWTAERPADWRERPPDWPPTRYEAKAVRDGRTPTYLRFLRY
ncbi:MAG: tRNA (guanosine(46)-N7)-methyltransferase TrmB [Alphaproteobacteria bacterium]